MSEEMTEIRSRIVEEFDTLTSSVAVGEQWIVPAEPTGKQRMRIVEVSGTLAFWDRPEEDVYSLNDGEPA